ncbi:hypothetical protein C7M61_001891 [Candidozyma pseudohaemuli]|uniref:Uncharacterized protein n=1 Tax=Candidozyma pseudohaemuli TaxID=418784 RepID=A0A2P7YTI8_9ASCO|nr:hypothetical protein C7M61_001891 [[Candida] pseudohaemulonii]PSK39284.1 hypothetical protein C7M61_001891 [[Candida] pseudohaemulonii]
MSVMLSWELWLDYQLSESIGSSSEFLKLPQPQHVLFADLPTTIPPAKHRNWTRRHLWKLRPASQTGLLDPPAPILKNKMNGNFEAEFRLLQESDNESFEEFHLRYMFPGSPEEQGYEARQKQLWLYRKGSEVRDIS